MDLKWVWYVLALAWAFTGIVSALSGDTLVAVMALCWGVTCSAYYMTRRAA